jgi:hypothetical protein
MLRKLGFIAIIGATLLNLAGCGPMGSLAAEETPADKITAVTTYPALTSDELTQFNEYIRSIRGKALLKLAEVRNQNEAYIQYYPNYDDYKAASADAQLSEAEFKNFFPVVDAINKVLMEESMRLLREFPALQKVTITIPYNNQIYAIDTSRRSMEMYLRVSFKKIHDELSQKQWKELKKKYFTTKERDKFAKRFIRAS